MAISINIINVTTCGIVLAVCLMGIFFIFVRIRHHLRIKPIILVTVCLIGILFVFVRVLHYQLSVNNYFIDVAEAEEVHDIVAAEFTIGESTKTDVENALNDGIFGELDCFKYEGDEFRTEGSDSQIYCDALASYDIFMPKYYLVILRFDGDVLVGITVVVSYPDAI